jgi:hypothetical protein
VFHPAMLDACLHLTIHRNVTHNADRNAYYLPLSIDQVILHDSLLGDLCASEVFVHAVMREWTPGNVLSIFSCSCLLVRRQLLL